MAVTAQGSGSQVCTVTTEHTLLDVAVAGTFVLEIDKNVCVALDVFEVRIYNIVLTGGTRRVAYFTTFSGAQVADDQILMSVPISNDLTDAGSLRFTLKQTFGTSRTVPWKILKFS